MRRASRHVCRYVIRVVHSHVHALGGANWQRQTPQPSSDAAPAVSMAPAQPESVRDVAPSCGPASGSADVAHEAAAPEMTAFVLQATSQQQAVAERL